MPHYSVQRFVGFGYTQMSVMPVLKLLPCLKALHTEVTFQNVGSLNLCGRYCSTEE